MRHFREEGGYVATVGERLKEERLLRGWSQRDLAQEAGTTAETISSIETGQHEPRPSTLRKLAEGLGIEVRDLFMEPALPKEPAREAGPHRTDAPPRASKERLEEYFDRVSDAEVAYLNYTLADFWRLAQPGEKPRAHFVPEDVDTDRVWGFLNKVLTTPNMFTPEATPEELERFNRGARKKAVAGR
jgi:transcriptional regulator with XRE-family HTH domain